MLGGAWILITVVLLITAVALRQAPLLLLAALFFLASGAARLWARYSLERLTYTRHLSATRAFFGETVTLEVRLANPKILPLPWVHVLDEMPQDLGFPDGRTFRSHKPKRAVLFNFVSLTWYHQVTRRYPVKCAHRGYFALGPAVVSSGDLFGFFHREREETKEDYLLVYPRVVPLERLGIPSRDPFGDMRVRQHLFEDPVRALTTRDYVFGDPLKRVHWKATARLNRLQTRVFEPTTTVDLAVFLDVRTAPPPYWGVSEQLLETAVITAASVASRCVELGYRVGMYANELYRLTDRTIGMPPSDHPEQLQRVLEALSQVQGWPFVSLEEMMDKEGRRLPWAATLVAITAAPTEGLLASLTRYRRAGRRVVLVVVGRDGSAPPLPGITVYHVPGDVYWREIESLGLSDRVAGGPVPLRPSAETPPTVPAPPTWTERDETDPVRQWARPKETRR